jgi:hypothetical protein
VISSPRAVPFLPDNDPYYLGYHFAAMARGDAGHHAAGWLNFQRSAPTREAHHCEPKALAEPDLEA